MMNSQIHDQFPLNSDHYYCPDMMCIRPAAPQTGVVGSSKPCRRRQRNKDAGMTGMTKRKLSVEQVTMLEQSFGSEQKLETGRKERLAMELGLESRQVAVWFQNRRARWRSKKLLEEYNKLRAQHDSAVLDKSLLEAQISLLKEKLEEAGKEIQRLNERSDAIWNNSLSSSMEAMIEQNPFAGFGKEGLESVSYELNCMSLVNDGSLGWDDLYYV